VGEMHGGLGMHWGCQQTALKTLAFIGARLS